MKLGSQQTLLGLGLQCFGVTVLLHFVLASSAHKNGLPVEGALREPEKPLSYERHMVLLGLSPKLRVYVSW